MARISAKGGFHLFWGVAISTIISSVGVILIARLLSEGEFGVIAIALTAPNLIMIFRDVGVNSAMIKFISQHRVEDEAAKVKNILAAGLLSEVALGSILSTTSFLLSGVLATAVFLRPNIAPLIQVASLTIIGGALQIATQAAFTGYEKMELRSVTMICYSVIKTGLGFLLVVLGFGALGSILGTTTAYLTAGTVGVVILYMTLYRKLGAEKVKLVETLKIMFRYGLPLSVSVTLSGFLNQFYRFLIAVYCTDQMIGNYQVALNFAVLITFVSTPILTVLFPAFSKLNPETEKEELRNVFRFSVKYAALLVVPAATAIITLAQPAVSTLFGAKYVHAPRFLTLISVLSLYSAFGSLSIGNLMNGQGKTRINLYLSLITAAVGLPLSVLMIPRFGIVGSIATTLAAGIPSLFAGLYWTKKHFTATIDLASSVKILAASALSAIITYALITSLSVPNWVRLGTGSVVFLAVYGTLVPLLGAVNEVDVQNLREMLTDFGFLAHLLEYPLKIIEKLSKTKLR
jgi:O-antigen/teichoic acid export membrane protein